MISEPIAVVPLPLQKGCLNLMEAIKSEETALISRPLRRHVAGNAPENGDVGTAKAISTNH